MVDRLDDVIERRHTTGKRKHMEMSRNEKRVKSIQILNSGHTIDD